MQKLNSTEKEFFINTTFSDNMVLQRDKAVRIFGYGGSVGEQVTVKFGENTYKGTIEENGWEVCLSPMSKDKTGKTLEVIYKDKFNHSSSCRRHWSSGSGDWVSYGSRIKRFGTNGYLY